MHYAILLKWLDRVLEKIKQVQAQKNRDRVESDPASWFNSHFSNRVRSEKSKTNPSDNRGADESRD